METPQQPAVPGPMGGPAPSPVAPAGPLPGPTVGPLPGAAPSAAGGGVVPRHRRLRLVLAMVGGIAALLCLGGVGIFVAVYDNATKIDRSTPDQVVSSFLRAYLVNRDDARAALLRCESQGDFAELEAYRDDIRGREQQYSVGIRVSWGVMTVATDADQTTVMTDLTKAIADGSEQTTDTWRFVVVNQEGWRVCGAGPVR